MRVEKWGAKEPDYLEEVAWTDVQFGVEGRAINGLNLYVYIDMVGRVLSWPMRKFFLGHGFSDCY